MRVTVIAEQCFQSGAFEKVGQRQREMRDIGRQTDRILPGLLSYTRKGCTFSLGLYDSHSFAVDK